MPIEACLGRLLKEQRECWTSMTIGSLIMQHDSCLGIANTYSHRRPEFSGFREGRARISKRKLKIREQEEHLS